MKKYRIIQKDDILCDGMEEKEALETLQMFRSNNPDKVYDIEVYNYNPLNNLLTIYKDLMQVWITTHAVS